MSLLHSVLGLSLLTVAACRTVAQVTFGQSFERGLHLYTEHEYAGPVGARSSQIVLDNQVNYFTFREVISDFMQWPANSSTPGEPGLVHFGHLEYGGRCVGVVQGNLPSTALILQPCSSIEDSSQILQYWMWDDYYADLTFLGHPQGFPLNVSYYIKDPILPDDVIYIDNHVSDQTNSLLKLGLPPSPDDFVE